MNGDKSLQEKKRLERMLQHENRLYEQNFKCLAGVDEAGRGPLAGPVVAAACILPAGLLIEGVNDSKQLSPKMRKELFHRLIEDPKIIYSVGIVEPEEIDRINIYQATVVAMTSAVKTLSLRPDYLLVDGMELKIPSFPSLKIIKGDQLSLSIAAASIIAKQTRDALMEQYHERWPEYGFAQHKGYGTKRHQEALKQMGPCPIHRKTFEPVKSYTSLAVSVEC